MVKAAHRPYVPNARTNTLKLKAEFIPGLGDTVTLRLHVSPISPLYPPCTSPVSLYLPCISHTGDAAALRRARPACPRPRHRHGHAQDRGVRCGRRGRRRPATVAVQHVAARVAGRAAPARAAGAWPYP